MQQRKFFVFDISSIEHLIEPPQRRLKPYVPVRPLMVWQRFYCGWLIEQIGGIAQELHGFALSLGAYCDHEGCYDW